MKIAYLVLTHRYPEQVVRLILRLNTENALFLVHIDKKTNDKIYQQIFSSISHLPNVYFLNRQSVYWGDFGMVAAAIEGIKELFNKQIYFDWLIFLSGQDYPIKSTYQIEEFLSKNKENLFIEYKDLVVTPPDISWSTSGSDRIDYWHFHLQNMRFVFPAKLKTNAYNRYCRANQTWFRIFSFLWLGLIFWFPIKRKFPEGFKPFWGSNYWCLSRDCIEYIHSFIQRNKAFVNYFKYVELPEEMFFQTIILNSKFKGNVINDNLFYIDWENPNPTRPRVFVKSDFKRLVECSKLFARKFDSTKDTDILDLLDQEVLADKKNCVNRLQS